MAVTLQQIAEACGVSRGTVDRALRDRGGIRPEVAQRIRETARQMGYIPRRTKPDVHPVRIGVVLHTGISEFVQQLAQNMREFPRQTLLPLEVIVRVMNDTDVLHQLALIDELLQEQIDGLVVMPLASARLRDKINAVAEQEHIPVVTVNTDIADCNRLAYVGPDDIACGRTAASLMGMTIGGCGRVLPILGQRSGHFADTQRLSGFLSEMSERYPQVNILPPEYCFMDSELAERITRRALRDVDDLAGIYLSSVGRNGVYRAIQAAGCPKNIHVVVHDLMPDNLRMIREGVVDFAIGQGMETQSTLPLRLLYQYLTKRIAPKKRRYTTQIDIRFRCNLLEE
jgi:LacI family transcriptional regulator